MRATQALAGPTHPSIRARGTVARATTQAATVTALGETPGPGQGTGDGGHRPQPAADEARRWLGQVQLGPVPEVLVAIHGPIKPGNRTREG